jgi:DNA polymerase II large subunit
VRDDDRRYFERIESRLDEAFDRAEAARARGFDPATDVEIPVAEDMAARVENILGIDGVATRVRDLEADHSREEAALALAEDFAAGRVGDYDTRAGKIEGAVRTAVALLTEGVVAAPIEGIDRVEILTNDDGSEFVSVHYAGPIRSAGGTGQALSVLVADYARALTGLSPYSPRDDEVERYVEEVGLYDTEQGLQYSPKDAEARYIAQHVPVMLDGEATGDAEVSGYRDLERVDGNAARGGMCLVLAEGIALKASKIQRYTRDLDEIDWPWLQDLIDGTVGHDDADEGDADDAEADDPADEAEDAVATPGPPRPEPSAKFLRDLIAGRPVFGHPSEAGGFRLRYGRARNHGFATAGVHPATMHVVDDFLATGTQIKTERPGKAAGVVPVDSIEGPTVRLADGTVRRIDDPAEAEALQNGVEAVLDLGEYLVNYGEFVENNRPLAPAGYAYEWWVQEFEATDADVRALRDDARVDLRHPTAADALSWAREFDAPLHPTYTYCWHDVSVAEFESLAETVAGAGRVVETETDGGVARRQGGATADALALPADDATARTLERLLVEHQQGDRITVSDWRPLVASLGLTEDLSRRWADLPPDAREWDGGENAVAAVNAVAPFRVRERAPTRVGCRMGRPEKSESRDLSPAVHTLFPIGEAGGSQRDVTEAAGTTTGPAGESLALSLGDRVCPECGDHTYRTRCGDCERHTDPYYECGDCGQVVAPDEAGRVHCDRCDRDVTSPTEWTVDLDARYREALARTGERETAFPILKGVKGLTSAHETPEPMEKGVLRAKHGVTAFKDGTVRYDMTDLPVTAVKPAELDVTADDLRELGYETDVADDPLRHDDQLVELKVQDVVLSDGAAEHMLRTADFVDDLLESLYDLPAFYDVADRQDLVGELVFGMAPHTSAAVVGRVVGFTSAAVGYAHPYFHAAKRRNCDGDEDCVMLLLDGLLNFSKEFLPDKRGGQMDAPLVMSSRIDPGEIDDEAHNVDVVDEYPREFYERTLEMADPTEADVRIAASTLGTDDQYRGFAHTHETTDIHMGPALSAYKTLGSMMEKTEAQLGLARRIHAVDERDVAERIIEYHFLPDLIGNLRAFSSQETRCLDCGTKYRRMPLTGDCRDCGGRVNLTVHEGSVTKYLDTAIRVADQYDCREYTKQRLAILERSIERVFEDDTNKQGSIADFM